MALPDVDACVALGADGWRALGRRLRAIGLTGQAVRPFDRFAAMANRPLHAPMVKWNLRRLGDQPRALATRMLVFWDAVTPEQARTVLGDEVPLERMLEIGLLRRTSSGDVVSPFALRLLGDRYVLGDDLSLGGEAVMGVAPSTQALVRVARPPGRLRRALDLGCGAGTIALALASTCDQVVATDINPRAVALARINVWLNDLVNVDCRVGDLFAPVEGETFDLITSQPPFVPRDDASPATTALFGGPRGDELVLALLGRLGPHLAPGGMAILMVEWPVIDGDRPLEERVCAALKGSPDVSTLVLQWIDTDVDEHCAGYATVGHPWQDEAYEQAAIRRRDYFDRAGIRALRPTFTVVRRGPPLPAWTATVQGRHPREVRVSRAPIDAMIAARDLVAQGRGALKTARLRVPVGVSLSQPGDTGDVEASLDARHMSAAVKTNAATRKLVTYVHEAERVEQAVERLAASEGVTVSEIADDALAGVERAVLFGLLELAAPAAS